MKRSLLSIGLSVAIVSLIALGPARADPTNNPDMSADVVTTHSSSSGSPIWVILLLLLATAAAS